MEPMPELAEAVILSTRFGNKLDVTLWWVRGTLDTFVTLDDYRTEPPTHHFLEVPADTNPNRVFYHPFVFINNGPTDEDVA